MSACGRWQLICSGPVEAGGIYATLNGSIFQAKTSLVLAALRLLDWQRSSYTLVTFDKDTGLDSVYPPPPTAALLTADTTNSSNKAVTAAAHLSEQPTQRVNVDASTWQGAQVGSAFPTTSSTSGTVARVATSWWSLLHPAQPYKTVAEGSIVKWYTGRIDDCQTLAELQQFLDAHSSGLGQSHLAHVSLKALRLLKQEHAMLWLCQEIQTQVASSIQVEHCTLSDIIQLLQSWQQSHTPDMFTPPPALIDAVINRLKWPQDWQVQSVNERSTPSHAHGNSRKSRKVQASNDTANASGFLRRLFPSIESQVPAINAAKVAGGGSSSSVESVTAGMLDSSLELQASAAASINNQGSLPSTEDVTSRSTDQVEALHKVAAKKQLVRASGKTAMQRGGQLARADIDALARVLTYLRQLKAVDLELLAMVTSQVIRQAAKSASFPSLCLLVQDIAYLNDTLRVPTNPRKQATDQATDCLPQVDTKVYEVIAQLAYKTLTTASPEQAADLLYGLYHADHLPHNLLMAAADLLTQSAAGLPVNTLVRTMAVYMEADICHGMLMTAVADTILRRQDPLTLADCAKLCDSFSKQGWAVSGLMEYIDQQAVMCLKDINQAWAARNHHMLHTGVAGAKPNKADRHRHGLHSDLHRVTQILSGMAGSEHNVSLALLKQVCYFVYQSSPYSISYDKGLKLLGNALSAFTQQSYVDQALLLLSQQLRQEVLEACIRKHGLTVTLDNDNSHLQGGQAVANVSHNRLLDAFIVWLSFEAQFQLQRNAAAQHADLLHIEQRHRNDYHTQDAVRVSRINSHALREQVRSRGVPNRFPENGLANAGPLKNRNSLMTRKQQTKEEQRLITEQTDLVRLCDLLNRSPTDIKPSNSMKSLSDEELSAVLAILTPCIRHCSLTQACDLLGSLAVLGLIKPSMWPLVECALQRVREEAEQSLNSGSMDIWKSQQFVQLYQAYLESAQHGLDHAFEVLLPMPGLLKRASDAWKTANSPDASAQQAVRATLKNMCIPELQVKKYSKATNCPVPANLLHQHQGKTLYAEVLKPTGDTDAYDMPLGHIAFRARLLADHSISHAPITYLQWSAAGLQWSKPSKGAGKTAVQSTDRKRLSNMSGDTASDTYYSNEHPVIDKPSEDSTIQNGHAMAKPGLAYHVLNQSRQEYLSTLSYMKWWDDEPPWHRGRLIADRTSLLNRYLRDLRNQNSSGT